MLCTLTTWRGMKVLEIEESENILYIGLFIVESSLSSILFAIERPIYVCKLFERILHMIKDKVLEYIIEHFQVTINDVARVLLYTQSKGKPTV